MKSTRSQTPNYKKIFTDIIRMKFPHKEKECKNLLSKKEILALDVIKLNQKIFGNQDKETAAFNQSHRSYSKKAIIEILEYQRKKDLSNSQLALQLKMSRSTISKWKRLFQNNLLNN